MGPSIDRNRSILGTILFTLSHVSTLATQLNGCHSVQYTDDTQFIHSVSIDNLSELIRTEETMNKIKKDIWIKNGVLLNAKKIQCMFTGLRTLLSIIPNNTIIHVKDTLIKPRDSVKNLLGLYFDKYMLFHAYIPELTKKSFGIFMYINRIRNLFSITARTTVTQTLVLRLTDKGVTVWPRHRQHNSA